MRLHNVLAVARKELQVLAKDRGTLAVLFMLPLLFGSIMGFIYGGASASSDEADPGIHIGIYVVNEDAGPNGEQVVALLRRMPVLDLDTTVDAAEADRRVGNGQKLAAVIIPADFSERIDAYEQATVHVLVDPVQAEYGAIVTGLVNYAVTPATVQGEIQYGIRTLLEEAGALRDDPARMQAAIAQSTGAVMTQLQAMQNNPAIRVQTEEVSTGKPTGPTTVASLIMPGMAVAFAFWLTGNIGAALHREKDHGTLRRLISSPVSRGELIAGNTLAYMTIVVLQVILLFGVAAAIFDMPLGQAPLGIFLIALALGVEVSAFGIMIGSLTRTGKQADRICTVLGFVLGGLSGALIFSWPPFYRAEGIMGTLARLTPHAPALEGYTRLLIEQGTLVDVLQPLAILLLFALVYASIATWRVWRLWQ